ncbi:MAG: SgcJ/EcaC family oxidoreductase [Pleurocapsa sp. SU_5_0]|nr:SgcJ/EcaC family oxidoreductase [Pleurocapsa sp. SU_5_0]NJR46898.1 SgcJ/EcaC family oxidoreductase [Hyellaceae cyanobacterium CSU_1_1]
MLTQIFASSVMISGLVLSSLAISASQVNADSENRHSAASVQTISDQNVQALGKDWGTALASRNVNQITALYAQEAVLLATFNDELDTPDEIKNYFIGLTQKPDLKVVFNTENVQVLDDNTVTNSGLYTFSYTENGKTVEVPARYTFLYEKKDDRWMIVKHHSSVRPEQAQ